MPDKIARAQIQNIADALNMPEPLNLDRSLRLEQIEARLAVLEGAPLPPPVDPPPVDPPVEPPESTRA